MPAAQLEAPITKKIMKTLKEIGAFRYKTHGAQDQIRGLPDIICCYRGRFFGLEVKRPGRRATPLQALTLEQIKLAGGVAGVVHSVEEAIELLQSVPESPVGGSKDPDKS
jgi:hypothetical protein